MLILSNLDWTVSVAIWNADAWITCLLVLGAIPDTVGCYSSIALSCRVVCSNGESPLLTAVKAYNLVQRKTLQSPRGSEIWIQFQLRGEIRFKVQSSMWPCFSKFQRSLRDLDPRDLSWILWDLLGLWECPRSRSRVQVPLIRFDIGFNFWLLGDWSKYFKFQI